jgi:uncharacterized protein YjbJ (UPF0337 family)
MNKDQVTGKVEQAAGRVKQGVGETLGNQKLANQGVADQVKGRRQGDLGQRQGRCRRDCGSPSKRSGTQSR